MPTNNRWTKLVCLVLILCWRWSLVYGLQSADRSEPAPEPLPPVSEGIQGIILNSETRQPLVRVHVALVPLPFGNDRPVYGAMTGQEGRFSISNVPAATYIVTLEKPGFVFLPDRHEKGENYFHITVDSGREPIGLKLEMTARATIFGHVLDEYGEPMPDIAVQLVPVRKDWVGEIAYGNSDDRGEFRFSSPPGRYYIKAGTWETLIERGST